jgi:hypothetical protein
MKSPTTPATLRDLIRAGDRFTDRDFMSALGIGHLKLKRAEADPSLFTVAELQILATLTGHPLKRLLDLVTAEMARNPQVAEAVAGKVEAAKEQVVGRKIAPPGLSDTFQPTARVAAQPKAKIPKAR